MNYIRLNRMLQLYDNTFDTLYEQYLHDFINDKNLMFIQEIDFISNVNFIRRCKGFLPFTDIPSLNSYILDVCFLYNYWQQVRTNDDYNMDKLDKTIKDTISHIKDTKNHIIDFIMKESSYCLNLLLNNDK